MYRATGQNTAKRALSKRIVKNVHSHGGHFLTQHGRGNDRRWCKVTKVEAQRKTRRELQETMVLKWTLKMPNSLNESVGIG
jgi:hypothetical protein